MSKVLVVDDSEITREIYRYTLEKLGDYEVLEAKNGRIAFDIFSNGSDIELIITDQDMPVMRGSDMVKKVREQNYKGDIIMISGEDDKDFIQSVLNLGVTEYFLKGDSPSDLSEIFAKYLA